MLTSLRAGAIRAAVIGLVGLTAPGCAEAALAAAPDLPARTPVSSPSRTGTAIHSISASQLEARLGRLGDAAGGGTGVWVYDATSERALFGSRASRRRVPASNEKLFTTATALDRLGAASRLKTSVWARGVPGDEQSPDDLAVEARRGVLNGDLYLVGDGDPALASRSFARRNGLPLTRLKTLARQVRSAGIRRVRGKLRVDASVFDTRRGTGVPGWSTYIGPLAGLTYNSGRGARDPARTAGRAFRRALRKAGVRIRGVARGRIPATLRREPALATVRSPTMAGLVDETNESSNNFFAEMLLKRLDAGSGRRGTTRGGARRVRRFARRVGTRVRARDGSGLSRRNRASPKQVGRLLVAMLDHEAGDAFHSSLPVVGREGTVRFRMRGTPAEGRCRAKTGTLSGVSALSGYCDHAKRTVAFSILMNGVDVAAARRLQDRMAAAIARYG